MRLPLLFVAALAAAALPAAHAQAVAPEFEGRATYRIIDSLFDQPGVRAAPGGVVAEIDVPLAEEQSLFVYLSRDYDPASDAPRLVAVTTQGDTVRSERREIGVEQLFLVNAAAGTVRIVAPGAAPGGTSYLEIASFRTGVGASADADFAPAVAARSARPIDAAVAFVAQATAGEPVLVEVEAALGLVQASLYEGDAFERGAPPLQGGGGRGISLWTTGTTGPVTLVLVQPGQAAADTVRVTMLGATASAFVPADSLRTHAARREAARAAAARAAGCAPVTADLRAGTVDGRASPVDPGDHMVSCSADREQTVRSLYWVQQRWAINDTLDGTVEPDVLGQPYREAVRTLGFEPAPGRPGTFVTPYGCLSLETSPGGTVQTVRFGRGTCGG